MTERLNFKKYGFTRVPEEDFSDDGNHFKMYDYKGIRISYLRDTDGDVYLSARATRDIEILYGIREFFRDVREQSAEISSIENRYNGVQYFTNEQLDSYARELDILKDKIYELKRSIEIHRINDAINIYTFGDHSWIYTYDYEYGVLTQKEKVFNLKDTCMSYTFKALTKAGFKIQEKVLKLDHIVDREWR